MKKESVLAVFALLCLALAVGLSIACNPPSVSPPAPGPKAQGPSPTVSSAAWQVPVDVFPPSPSPTPTPTQNDWRNLGWQTFIALDWPALSPNSGGVLAQPDTNLTIGATASNGALIPTVWNTYRDVSTLMLAGGKDPGNVYNQPVIVSPNCPAMGSNPVAPGFKPLYIDNSTFSEATLPKSYTNEAFTGPLIDQKGWYTLEQIFIAPSEYSYIQGNGYYVGQNQVNDYNKNGKLAPFPKTGQGMGLPSWAQYGALEVKATWRVLDPVADKAIIPRYYTQWGYFMQADGQTCQGPTLFGLIALHILRLTPSTGATWFWASFEQIDNTMPPSGTPATIAAPNTPNGACTNQYNVQPSPVSGNIPWNNSNTPNNICQVTLIPGDMQKVNQTWRNQLQGTVWRYYQMVDTLNPCSPGDASCYIFPPIKDPTNTINLNVYANSSVESYFQTTTCMDCHGSAAGNGVPQPLTGTNQIFTFVLQNAYYTGSDAAATRQRFLRLFKHPPRGKTVAAPQPK
jgi:hypothetical protein